jgi:hypothetical protein
MTLTLNSTPTSFPHSRPIENPVFPGIKIPFPRITVRKHALALLTSEEILQALARHSRGDWGNVDPEDAERNIEAWHEGSEILSAYGTGDRRFCIITAGDLSETVVLLLKDFLGGRDGKTSH